MSLHVVLHQAVVSEGFMAIFNVAFYQAGLEFTRRLNMASLRLASFQRG